MVTGWCDLKEVRESVKTLVCIRQETNLTIRDGVVGNHLRVDRKLWVELAVEESLRKGLDGQRRRGRGLCGDTDLL